MRRFWMVLCYFLLLTDVVFLTDISNELWAVTPVVEIEEDVLRYTSPNNGAGPLWCYGSPVMVRIGDQVFLSINETGVDVPPLCNTRWRLFERKEEGWEMQAKAERFREREPCPLVTKGDSLYLSINPSTEPPGVKYGPCEPKLLKFPISSPTIEPKSLLPAWAEGSYFTDHSYRGIAADRISREILLLNIHARTGDQFWCLLDQKDQWIAQGKVSFPIRSCYPQVGLQQRSGHIMAIGDIVEPTPEWRAYKKEQTGREWDYVFRRLFYTWSPDLTRQEFTTPIEIENVDPTAGYIRNLDMWLAEDGSAYLLYTRNPVQNKLMRDRFFPDMKLQTFLDCAVVKEGKIIKKFTMAQGGEGMDTPQPQYARFHTTPDGQLYVVMTVTGNDGNGNSFTENRVQRILPYMTKPAIIQLDDPFRSFFTNTVRGGSKPSNYLDLYGICSQGNVLRYARIKLK